MLLWENVSCEINVSCGEETYKKVSNGILIGIEQEPDGRKSVLALEGLWKALQ